MFRYLYFSLTGLATILNQKMLTIQSSNVSRCDNDSVARLSSVGRRKWGAGAVSRAGAAAWAARRAAPTGSPPTAAPLWGTTISTRAALHGPGPL